MASPTDDPLPTQRGRLFAPDRERSPHAGRTPLLRFAHGSGGGTYADRRAFLGLQLSAHWCLALPLVVHLSSECLAYADTSHQAKGEALARVRASSAMDDWQRFSWADGATEATVAVVADGASEPRDLLRRLGPTDDAGPMTFDAALELQGSFYDDHTFDDRAVFQVDRLRGRHGHRWGLVEPNGFRASFEDRLLKLARGGHAVSFFWNVNAVMSLLRVQDGGVVTSFDPLLDVEQAREEGADLPFGDEHPRAAALALVERWTGVTITEAWFVGAKRTFVVETPSP